MKILHIVTDEKFIDTAYELFEEVAPGASDFLLLGKERKLDHIKKAPVCFSGSRFYIPNKIIESLENYSFVVVHSLSGMAKLLVKKAPKEVRFVWVGFGFDYYPYINKFKNKILLERTEILKKKLEYSSLKKSFLLSLKIKAVRVIFGSVEMHRILPKISYFIPVIKDEYKMVKEGFSVEYFPSYCQWNYSSLYKAFGKYPVMYGEGILVGNSASVNNNHLEALDIVDKSDVAGRSVYCPLSYGGMPGYVEAISSYGNSLFGNNFRPLTEFLERESYFKIIFSCSHVIMNHIRQQGAGNVYFMLYCGAKVFLREENPLYLHFKNLGFLIFSIEQLEQSPKLLKHSLSSEEAGYNQRLLEKIRSKEVVINETRSLIKTLCRK